MFSPKIILHPTDFSDSSRCALQIASDLALKYTAKLIVLHAVETVGPANVTFGEVEKQLEPQGYLERLSKELRTIKPDLPSDHEVEYLLVEGDPAPGIVSTADERHCDLIVMGTHGRRGLGRILMGSVAEHVVRNAPCAVLTVKSPRPAAAS
jgi:nucleotide-binding universal stress UspA family protein